MLCESVSVSAALTTSDVITEFQLHFTTMDDYEGRHEVEQSLADVEQQLAAAQDYMGLDARHPRVRDFIKCKLVAVYR